MLQLWLPEPNLKKRWEATPLPQALTGRSREKYGLSQNGYGHYYYFYHDYYYFFYYHHYYYYYYHYYYYYYYHYHYYYYY